MQKWKAVLIQYPIDLLALKLVHYTMVLLGDVLGYRDGVTNEPCWFGNWGLLGAFGR